MIDHDAADLWIATSAANATSSPASLHLAGQQAFDEIARNIAATRIQADGRPLYRRVQRLLEEVSRDDGPGVARTYSLGNRQVYTCCARGRPSTDRVPGPPFRHRTLADRGLCISRDARRASRSWRNSTTANSGPRECVPYAGMESIDSVSSQIEAMRAPLAQASPRGFAERHAARAARNALDCAFWDLEASAAAGQSMTGGLLPARADHRFTISLAAPPRWPKPRRSPVSVLKSSSAAIKVAMAPA